MLSFASLIRSLISHFHLNQFCNRFPEFHDQWSDNFFLSESNPNYSRIKQYHLYKYGIRCKISLIETELNSLGIVLGLWCGRRYKQNKTAIYHWMSQFVEVLTDLWFDSACYIHCNQILDGSVVLMNLWSEISGCMSRWERFYSWSDQVYWMSLRSKNNKR